MPTTRTNILNTLSSDLAQILPPNGYINSMKYVKNGALMPNEIPIGMYPSAGFVVNSDEPYKYLTEDLNLEVRKLDISIVVYTNEENKPVAIENMICDMNKLFKDDDSILPIYQSQINQIDGVWSEENIRCLNIGKISQITEAGLIHYPISIYYLSEFNGNANGSNELPVIPNILEGYSLTSHQHNQYTLTGDFINLENQVASIIWTGSVSGISTTAMLGTQTATFTNGLLTSLI
ncbi:MAG: hypothetical protein PHN88_09190 [Ignavibacteria bacterium]|nr:hypothetical protein [Ignavibacteria bacterium]